MRRVTATLLIRRRVEEAVDRYGNPTVSYAPGVEWPVYAVAPRSAGEAEPFVGLRDAVVRGLQVFAPVEGPRPGPHDLVEYWGEKWEVVGDVAVWDNNPHVLVTTERGIVVNLERKEG